MLDSLGLNSIIRRTLFFTNIGMAVLVGLLAWVDIYFYQMTQLMGVLQTLQLLMIAGSGAYIYFAVDDSHSKRERNHVQQATQQQRPVNPSQPVATPAKELTMDDIETQIALSLDGLVGFEHFIKNLAHELTDFMKKQPGESKGIVVWGDASVGKTEFAQRVAGLRRDFKIPGLSLPNVVVKYIASCDGQIDISREVNQALPKTIIILDEIDKFFDPKSGIVDEAQAKKLRTSIVTNFQSKPIFWIFIGTFHDLRGKNRLTEKDLSKTLGTELTSRLDFADWRLPSWTIETLMLAGKPFLDGDSKDVEYDDEGALVLVEQALKSGGGVRTLQRYHDYFKRQASKKNAKIAIGKPEATAYLEMLNAE